MQAHIPTSIKQNYNFIAYLLRQAPNYCLTLMDDSWDVKTALFSLARPQNNDAVFDKIRDPFLLLERGGIAFMNEISKKEINVENTVIEPNYQILSDPQVAQAINEQKPRLIFQFKLDKFPVDILVSMATTNPGILGIIKDKNLREQVWTQLQAHLIQHGLKLPNPMMTNCDTFVANLARFTKYPERFSNYKTLFTLWTNTELLLKNPSQFFADPRKIGLVLANTDDWNGAFARSSVHDAAANAEGFKFVYLEVASDTAAATAIIKSSNAGASPIHSLIISGHGSKDTLALGGDDLRLNQINIINDLPAHLDREDFKKGFFYILESFIDPHGQIFLDACSTGEGGNSAKNLANQVRQAVGNGVRIYSSQVPTNVYEMTITETAMDIQFTKALPYNSFGSKGNR